MGREAGGVATTDLRRSELEVVELVDISPWIGRKKSNVGVEKGRCGII